VRMTPDHRALVLAALGLMACGPIEEEEGVLGNGEFVYTCVGGQDPSCGAITSLSPENLPFPSKIALGGRFALSYSTEPGSLFGVPSNVQAASSDWLPCDATGAYAAMRVGQPWIVAIDSDGGLKDMLSLTIARIASITVAAAQPPTDVIQFGPTPPPTAYVAGTTHTFAATALDTDGTPLAGDVPYFWASSDPSVVFIVGNSESPTDSVTVEYVAGGTAALYAWTSTAQGATTLTVPGGASTDDDAGGASINDAGVEAGVEASVEARAP
jgi:hypothetical protein